jgi:fructuronate reductase
MSADPTSAAPVPIERKGKRATVGIVHLGLGAFHRAHQAWYTDAAPDASRWGIAAFTGRRPDAARVLAGQDCIFSLIEKSATGNRFHQVESIVEAHDGADVARLCALLATPAVGVVTLTITENGYALDVNGRIDPQVSPWREEIQRLRSGSSAVTALGRLVSGLDARRVAGAGPIAVVPCDNLAGNGAVTRAALDALAAAVDADLAQWMTVNVSVVSTSVDRITPAATPDDELLVREALGRIDNAPVVTEEFSSWILSGDFPAGRPDWEAVGAEFVEDITPFESRKLWMLNGAHLILAFGGLLRGHRTVFDAMSDPALRTRVDRFWDTTARHLSQPGLNVEDYRDRLTARFLNPSIAHTLTQIAKQGSTKLGERIVPVIALDAATNDQPGDAVEVLALWWAFVAAFPPTDAVDDVHFESITDALDPVRLPAAQAQALLDLVYPGWASIPTLPAALLASRASIGPLQEASPTTSQSSPTTALPKQRNTP